MAEVQLPAAAVQIRQQLQAQAAALLAQFERLANIRHRALSGAEREGPVREFLRSHVPGRFLVSTGTIASATENPGSQHDIVIADANHCLLLLAATSANLFPIESVHAIVEIRSGPGLDLLDMGESLAKLRRLKVEPGLARYGPMQTRYDVGTTAPAMHTVLAYRGPKDPELVIRDLEAANAEHTKVGGRHVIDSILVLSANDSVDLKSGYVIGYSKTVEQDDGSDFTFPHHYYPTEGEQGLHSPDVVHRGEDSFAYWYASLLNHLGGVIAYPPNLIQYLGFPYRLFEVGRQME
jgi:hypothetical protein